MLQVPKPQVQVQVQVLRSQVQVQVQVTIKYNTSTGTSMSLIKNQTAPALNEYRSVSYYIIYITIYMDFTSLQYCRCYCLFHDKLTVG